MGALDKKFYGNIEYSFFKLSVNNYNLMHVCYIAARFPTSTTYYASAFTFLKALEMHSVLLHYVQLIVV